MCGIAGIVWKGLPAWDPARRIDAMTNAVIHRGPDASGRWVCGPVALGHRRLSIIDLSDAGRQPMENADGSLVITFNGEIYNYLELRDELQQLGARFHTESDTEVILEAFRHWGPACVKRFNGMWAFAIWQPRTQELFLSRDRFGIKPLYILQTDGALAFASEVKSILAAFDEERRPNEAVIRHFLAGGAVLDGPESFFERIVAFPAAHCAMVRADDLELQPQRFWNLAPRQYGGNDPIGELSHLLDSSVELHMRSDVPVGTCLSGGLDSSTIVATMAKLRRSPVHTFSGLYPDAECDEHRWVDAVNRHCGTIAVPIRPEPHGDLLDDMTTIGWHQDGPSAGPGLYTQFHVMRRARRDVKVILDGQGGDELFAGYIPYFLPYLRDLNARGVRGRVDAAALSVAIVRHWGRAQPGAVARALLPEAAVALARRARGRRVAPPPSELFDEDFLHRTAAREIHRATPRVFAEHLTDTLYWDVVARRLPELLHYEDRNSMAYGIEARVPLLDHRIVEFAFALDSDWKIHGSWTKWVLRKAAESRLPRTVTWRRSKMGYPTPFGRWLRQPAERGPIEELLFSATARSRTVMAMPVVQRVWDAHQAGADHSWLLWRLISLEIWFRQFIDAWRPSPATREG